MSTPFPTIQNFYPPVSPPSKQYPPHEAHSPSKSSTTGDGFTLTERAREINFDPSTQLSPEHDYDEVSIGDLYPGPRYATFTCRVVNMYDQTIESKMPQSAKGCLKILVKDESGTILIKLWYASTTYHLRLGTLLTCWTTHIHSTSSLTGVNEATTAPSSLIVTSIFPERDSGCHIQIHSEEGCLSACCRTPPGYIAGSPLPGLMSLSTYTNGGGSSNADVHLLVCVVAISEPTTGTQFQGLDIGIADHSIRATLSVSAPLFPSAQSWRKNHTVLLLSRPKLRTANRISPTAKSHIEIDPDIADAASLRRYILRSNCPINQPFPENLLDINAINSSPQRLQFTWGTLSEFVGAGPDQIIIGYISVILSRVNLCYLVARRRVFSMECCGMPIYANTTSGRCGQCGQTVGLRVNPDVVGGLADEMGGVGWSFLPQGSRGPGTSTKWSGRKGHSKVLWSDEAWCQLLGRGPEELALFCREDVNPKVKKENANLLRYLEQRLLWMRVILLVSWTGEVCGGRVAVLRVVE